MAGERFYEARADNDGRRSAPAALRNREPIADVLRKWLPERGVVLEIASGSGEHGLYFAERFPGLEWQPTDVHENALASIEGWREQGDRRNLRPPLRLDASAEDWPVGDADAVLSINMAHISPWAASLGLIAGAARILPEGGALILYGPWLKDGIETAPSNLAFDSDLKRRNPEWGLRRVEDFAEAAAAKSLALTDWRQMPANNLMLLLRKQG